jgi:hypothetical protein
VIEKSAVKAGVPKGKLQIVGKTLEDYEASCQGKQFDWIILGNVLCEVKDPGKALISVDHLLKNPVTDTDGGGHVFFSEHFGNEKASWVRFLQDWLNPIWKLAAAGCNLNRDTLDLILSQHNWKTIHWIYEFAAHRWAIGLAQKCSPQ